MKNKFISFLLFPLLFTSTLSYAQESNQLEQPKITHIEKSQTAPWSGVLFSNLAAAQVAATYTISEERIKIERENEKEKCDAACKKTVSDILATHDREMSVISARVDRLEKEKQQFLEIIKEKEKENSSAILWAGIGFGSATIITLVIVYAVGTSMSK